VHCVQACSLNRLVHETCRLINDAGVEWLIAKYKCYMMMRERLVMDTPQLRDKLTSAKPGTGTPMWCALVALGAG
jgi:hypothetical protein